MSLETTRLQTNLQSEKLRFSCGTASASSRDPYQGMICLQPCHALGLVQPTREKLPYDRMPPQIQKTRKRIKVRGRNGNKYFKIFNYKLISERRVRLSETSQESESKTESCKEF